MRWRHHAFAELTLDELYAIMALRERVFVVEQRCAYLDADGHDQVAQHVWHEDDDRAIRCYARILPAGVRFASVNIGRVIVAPEARGTGLGRDLMQYALGLCGRVPVELGAQAHLEAFYASLGFARSSDVYDEDGIAHVDMLRAA